MASATTPTDEKFTISEEIAGIYKDKLANPQKAIAAHLEALNYKPNDRQLLHNLLDLFSETKQWKKAMEILGKLAEIETGKVKARYLVAAGNIANYELHSTDEAVEIYNQALDEDPGRSEGVRAHRQDHDRQEGLEEPGAELPADDQAPRPGADRPSARPRRSRCGTAWARFIARGSRTSSRRRPPSRSACSSIRTRRRATRSWPSSISSRAPSPTTRRSTSTATSSR